MPVIPALWEAQESLEPRKCSCCEPRLCHCTPAWVTERASVSKNKKNEKNRKNQTLSALLSGVLGSIPSTKLKSLACQVFHQKKKLPRVNVVTCNWDYRKKFYMEALWKKWNLLSVKHYKALECKFLLSSEG